MLTSLTFKGRLNRLQFFFNYLISLFVIFLGALIGKLLGGAMQVLILGVVVIFIIVYVYSLQVRRFHDLGKTGWLVLLNLIPLVNLIMLIYLLFFPGEKKTNKYGPKPK